MEFKDELEFEEALTKALINNGWHDGVIKNASQEELIENWRYIINGKNNTIDRLNDCELTHTEMQQILHQIEDLKTPFKLNGLIIGETVQILRDNKQDLLHCDKTIPLDIFRKNAIAGAGTVYQIARQCYFKRGHNLANDRRGDITLLIDGLPLIHVELKRSGVSVEEAFNQIDKYLKEDVFTGIYRLIQIFVVMTPNECWYFANPGHDGQLLKLFAFKWSDANNVPITEYQDIARTLLSIPMAHEMISYYTIADDGDGVLKVLRSYQYEAVKRIVDTVKRHDWNSYEQRGGYIWHTTGSGKTMTSYKTAQLIAQSNNADKVIFLLDRIELGTQSVGEFNNFASENSKVVDTKSTYDLIKKLKSTNPSEKLIVTSIQKMSRIYEEEYGLNVKDLEKMTDKRIVFIVDEAHRSTFGDMLYTIKNTFKKALFFGFTGTPIYDENKKNDSTTVMIFGDELARYSIADGINDKNVLGFDQTPVNTFDPYDIKREIAFQMCKTRDMNQIRNDEQLNEIYCKFTDPSYPMAGDIDEHGNYIKGIEDYVPTSQYDNPVHQETVVKDILRHWDSLSQNRYHAIFATSSIKEALDYYHLFKKKAQYLNVCGLFDPNIDNRGDKEERNTIKEQGLLELLADYKDKFGRPFDLASFANYKKDIQDRLAHKNAYKYIDNDHSQQIDILIVVDQLLTGYDSKWVNTLFLDKMLAYENIIQAFSRTNRLHKPEKKYGIIRYYRKPYTMRKNISKAVKLYSGDRPVDLFVDKLPQNVAKMNLIFKNISDLFKSNNIQNFEMLPSDKEDKAKFSQLFTNLHQVILAAKTQGFQFAQDDTEVTSDTLKEVIDIDEYGNQLIGENITVAISQNDYNKLLQRYKEIGEGGGGENERKGTTVPYNLDGYILSLDTTKIDADYMNSKFDKYYKELKRGSNPDLVNKTLEDLHKTFGLMSEEDQQFAHLFLHDIESGTVFVEEGKTFKDYIIEYKVKAQNDNVTKFANNFGLDANLLRELVEKKPSETTLNEYGLYDELKKTLDIDKAKGYLYARENVNYPNFRVNVEAHKEIKKFILSGGKIKVEK